MDDMHCPTCGADVYDKTARSVSVVAWNPETQTNELIAVLCAHPACLRDWAVKRVQMEPHRGD